MVESRKKFKEQRKLHTVAEANRQINHTRTFAARPAAACDVCCLPKNKNNKKQPTTKAEQHAEDARFGCTRYVAAHGNSARAVFATGSGEVRWRVVTSGRTEPTTNVSLLQFADCVCLASNVGDPTGNKHRIFGDSTGKCGPYACRRPARRYSLNCKITRPLVLFVLFSVVVLAFVKVVLKHNFVERATRCFSFYDAWRRDLDLRLFEPSSDRRGATAQHNQTTNDKPQTTNDKRQTTNDKPQTTNYEPQTHKAQTTNYKPQTRSHKPEATPNTHARAAAVEEMCPFFALFLSVLRRCLRVLARAAGCFVRVCAMCRQRTDRWLLRAACLVAQINPSARVADRRTVAE